MEAGEGRAKDKETGVKVMKGHRGHHVAGIAMLTLFVFCVASFGFVQAPERVVGKTTGFYGNSEGGLPAPDRVTLAGREESGNQAKRILPRQESNATGSEAPVLASPAPITMGEGVADAPGGLDAQTGTGVESAAPEIIPGPGPGVNPPSDLVGVFVPSATPYVELTWKGNNQPKFLREFRVYRVVAGSGEDVVITPIGRTKKERFRDYQLELGTTYTYWVTAVSKGGEESAPSNQVEVETFKDQPPEPPQGLVAAAIDPGVCLDWEPSVSPDIAGYMVYLVADGGNYQPLTREPLADNHYYHREGVAGNLYAVCTVNLFGTKSEYVLAEATVSQPTYFEENNPGVWVEGLWVSEAYPEASGGRIIVAGAKGDRLHFRFTGRQVRVVSAMYWTCGSAAMYIDGQYITSVNLYSYDPLFGSVTLDVPGLRYGEHTFTVEVLGTGNPEVDLYFVNVDAFEVR